MGKLNLEKTKSKMSKINQETLKKSIAFVRENRKERKFVETMDLQILLRDYNPDKEKRFNSSMVLPHMAKSNIKVCVIANINHLDQCKKAGVACVDMDAIKKFNKQGAAQIGKILSSVHKLPLVISENEKVSDKIKELNFTCKWRMKKVPWLAQGVGIDTLKDEELRQNINKSLNFLISLLPKGWNNIRTINCKFSMGRPSRIF